MHNLGCVNAQSSLRDRPISAALAQLGRTPSLARCQSVCRAQNTTEIATVAQSRLRQCRSGGQARLRRAHAAALGPGVLRGAPAGTPVGSQQRSGRAADRSQHPCVAGGAVAQHRFEQHEPVSSHCASECGRTLRAMHPRRHDTAPRRPAHAQHRGTPRRASTSRPPPRRRRARRRRAGSARHVPRARR
jgi:hypothetical protein